MIKQKINLLRARKTNQSILEWAQEEGDYDEVEEEFEEDFDDDD